MIKRLRLTVRSTRTRSFGWAWVAACETETGSVEHIRYGYAPSMPEALADGHHALKTLDRILMTELHEAQARRRTLTTVSTPLMEATA